MVLEAKAVSRATTLVALRSASSRRECRITMPVGKGRCARDAQPLTFDVACLKPLTEFYHNKAY